jgi:hypothetical protein
MALVGSLIFSDGPTPNWAYAPRWSPLTLLTAGSPLRALEGQR